MPFTLRDASGREEDAPAVVTRVFSPRMLTTAGRALRIAVTIGVSRKSSATETGAGIANPKMVHRTTHRAIVPKRCVDGIAGQADGLGLKVRANAVTAPESGGVSGLESLHRNEAVQP
ncbi:MAG: hypothetical protein Kow0040_28610 [Thermogutta sp.]